MPASQHSSTMGRNIPRRLRALVDVSLLLQMRDARADRQKREELEAEARKELEAEVREESKAEVREAEVREESQAELREEQEQKKNKISKRGKGKNSSSSAWPSMQDYLEAAREAAEVPAAREAAVQAWQNLRIIAPVQTRLIAPAHGSTNSYCRRRLTLGLFLPYPRNPLVCQPCATSLSTQTRSEWKRLKNARMSTQTRRKGREGAVEKLGFIRSVWLDENIIDNFRPPELLAILMGVACVRLGWVRPGNLNGSSLNS